MPNDNFVDHLVHAFAEEGKPTELKDVLRDQPSLVDLKNSLGDTALHIAASQERLDVVKLLVEFGANVNESGYLGFTPLHSAVIDGDKAAFEIVRELLNAGADPNIPNANGRIPLDYAKTKWVTLASTIELLNQYR